MTHGSAARNDRYGNRYGEAAVGMLVRGGRGAAHAPCVGWPDFTMAVRTDDGVGSLASNTEHSLLYRAHCARPIP